MANVNEESQERETYGDAPGWSGRETTKEPVNGAKETHPLPEDAAAAPSAEVVEETQEQEQVTEQGTPPTTQPEPPRYNPPPKERWDELVSQANDAKRQRDEALRLAQEAIQRVSPPVQMAPQIQDQWEPLIKSSPDIGTAQFWTQMRQLVQHERQQAKADAVAEMAPMIQAGMEKLAQIDVREFRKENPDIKPGSPEEQQIIAYMTGQVDGIKHPMESAKRNAQFERLQTEVKAYKTKQAAIPQKRAAASSEASAGIPAGSGLPGKKNGWEDRVGEVLDKGGSLRDAAKHLFGA